MATARFQINSEQMNELESKLEQLHGIGESLINDVVHTEGIEMLTDDILRHVRVSRTSRTGKHARDSEPFKAITFNLGFLLVTKGGAARNKNSFGYLVFPDEGRGYRNPIEQDFTGRGSEMATPRIMDILNQRLTEKIEEVI